MEFNTRSTHVFSQATHGDGEWNTAHAQLFSIKTWRHYTEFGTCATHVFSQATHGDGDAQANVVF
jgi:hypothetical protein